MFSSGADEWLSLCKEVKRLCDKYGVGAESEDPANKQVGGRNLRLLLGALLDGGGRGVDN